MYQITIQRQFTATHAIRLHDGSLEPLHSHDWQVQVTVGCDRLDAIDTVMDFHDLQRRAEQVLAPWQGRCLNDVAPFARDGRLHLSPTAEHVARSIAQQLAPLLPAGVRLVSTQVTEAPGCMARWVEPDL